MTGKMLEDNAVARCMITDYKGIVSTEDDYVVVNRVPLTPYVVIQAKGLELLYDAHNRVIDTIEMMDGGHGRQSAMQRLRRTTIALTVSVRLSVRKNRMDTLIIPYNAR